KDNEFSACRRQGLLHEGNAELLVVVDAEGLELLIAFVDIRIAATREIATMNVGASERITDAVVGIEIGIQKFKLFCGGQFCKGLRCGIGKCAAYALDCLKGSARIHKHANLSLQRLAEMLEFNLVSRRNSVFAPLGSCINDHLFSCD